MTRSGIKNSLVCILLSAWLAACEPVQLRIPGERSSASSVAVGKEERKAVLALSIGDSTGLRNAGDPYMQAQLCVHALASVAERARAGSQNSSGIDALTQAQVFLESRMRSLANAAGKSASEIDEDRALVATNNPDVISSGRIAIACIKQIANKETRI